VNIKIAGKWMFIPLKMVLIGIDPYPYPKMAGSHLLAAPFTETLLGIHQGHIEAPPQAPTHGQTSETTSCRGWAMQTPKSLFGMW